MKKTRNKALAVLDGKIELAQREWATLAAASKAANEAIDQLVAAREAVARAYERKAAGRRGRAAAPVAKDGAAEVSA